jgi:hypothetical protein
VIVRSVQNSQIWRLFSTAMLLQYMGTSVISGCSKSDQDGGKGGEAAIEEDKSSATKKKKSRDADEDDPDSGDEGSGAGTGPSTGTGTAAGTGTGGGEKIDPELELFFNTKVRDAVFTKSCIRCHVGPRVAADPRGPEKIYVYASMRPHLLDSESPVKNSLVGKMVNVIRHSGGDVCPGGLGDPACKAVLDWYEKERGTISERAALVKPVPANNGITGITDRGTINGWATNPANLAETVQVKLYIDGDNNSGKTPITFTANQEGYDSGADGGHAFSGNLPDEVIDSKQHRAFFYFVVGGTETAMNGSPMTFYAYKPNLARGKPFFDSTIASAISGCGCHTDSSYERRFVSLLSPTPDKGGNRDNNVFIKKISGGLPHTGGTFCTGALCDNVKLWWDREFGP